MKGPVALHPGRRHRPRRAARHHRAGRDGRASTPSRPQQRDEAFAPAGARQSACWPTSGRSTSSTGWTTRSAQLVGEPTEDLVVETTLDLPLQAAAEQARAAPASPRRQGQGVQQARAGLAGRRGPGARLRRRRRLLPTASSTARPMARRQAGSAFKPFVYLTAMEAGRTPDDAGGRRADHHRQLDAAQLHRQVPRPDHPARRRWRSRSTPSPRGWPTRSAPPTWRATAHRLGITSPIQTRPVHGAGRGRGQPAGDGPGL